MNFYWTMNFAGHPNAGKNVPVGLGELEDESRFDTRTLRAPNGQWVALVRRSKHLWRVDASLLRGCGPADFRLLRDALVHANDLGVAWAEKALGGLG